MPASTDRESRNVKSEKALTLTGGEQDDGFQAAVLGRVDVQSFEFLDLLLKYSYVVHEGDYPVRSHGCCVQSRRRQ